MARSFNGSSEYITLPTSFSAFDQQTAFTISCWINMSGAGTYRTMLAGDQNSCQFRVTDAENLQIVRQANTVIATSSGTISGSTWTQAGWVYDHVNQTFYIGGSASGTGAEDRLFISPTSYRLGAQNVGAEWFNGNMAEFAVWSAALTAGEMAALGKGYSPLFIRPASLWYYVPLLRENVAYKKVAPTFDGGTAVVAHSPIIRTVSPKSMKWTTAAAPTGRIFRLAGYGGGLVGPQVGLAG